MVAIITNESNAAVAATAVHEAHIVRTHRWGHNSHGFEKNRYGRLFDVLPLLVELKTRPAMHDAGSFMVASDTKADLQNAPTLGGIQCVWCGFRFGKVCTPETCIASYTFDSLTE